MGKVTLQATPPNIFQYQDIETQEFDTQGSQTITFFYPSDINWDAINIRTEIKSIYSTTYASTQIDAMCLFDKNK